ncbi:MAG: hypothetical protein JO033_19280 [Acidobacteriaceae bacterium]|nr:hypothetical protein [Acidobacteriaceae bacterium]MBV9501565.1 hypothetical protein [Acidobacteriaceae bacterium]
MGFFPDTISLRLVPPFDRYLALADAFARACYELPICFSNNIAIDQLCPTPFVTFNDQISPWAKPAEAEETGAITVLQLAAQSILCR